ncbi:hypothetical protein P9272_13815 [Mesorhizobium sp. WSM4976]|uniref:hypothetical protein n=1 Tax=Mesorhizobium sp. WSM4976 TaxID=3038549 RepID=UPI002417809B|nr:hypothetical protein [Mesorhizobium sp. WSM4976]MDG4894650.1 hypothetical protein [Mesorhizobium sp. WSM4976]
MRFTLTYDGELASAGNGSKKSAHKWELRTHFHPQLKELWETHPALKRARHGVVINPKQPFMSVDGYHKEEIRYRKKTPEEGEIDLTDPIERFGCSFRPFVRDTFALNCAINIIFLRKEPPGKVYQGGDLDNRIKTLLDALSMPQYKEQMQGYVPIEEPMFCLMEDDSFLTKLSITTERLLTKPEAGPKEVRLNIEVDVRVSDARVYNTPFLSD